MTDEDTDILEEIPPSEWTTVKELYQRNGERKIYACNFIDMAYRWRTICGYTIKLFAIKNDRWQENGSVIFIFDSFLSAKKSDEKTISVRYFSLEDTPTTLYNILQETNYINWNTETVDIGLLHTDHTNGVLDFAQKRSLSVVEFLMAYNWKVAKEDALAYQIDVPDTTYLKSISVKYAQQLYDEWPMKFLYNSEFIKPLLTHNDTVGLFNANDHSMITSIVHREHGGLGMLHTDPAHRSKGYATIVTKAICKQLAQKGVTPTLSSLVENIAAENFYRKLNFKQVNFLQWITLKKL